MAQNHTNFRLATIIGISKWSDKIGVHSFLIFFIPKRSSRPNFGFSDQTFGPDRPLNSPLKIVN